MDDINLSRFKLSNFQIFSYLQTLLIVENLHNSKLKDKIKRK